jgi:hypothetical protein
MAVQIINPGLTAVPRRSAAKGTADILTGRLVKIDSTGRVVVPGTQRVGLYLALEGNLLHTGDAVQFGASPFDSTRNVELPSNAAAGQVALAYGVFVYEVGSEGCDPTATYVQGTLVASDNFGRLVPISGTDAEDAAFGIVEAVVLDGSNRVTKLTVRTLGQ